MEVRSGSWIYLKGKEYEYELMRRLKRLGYFVMRSPGSGRGYRKLYAPDVVAIKRGKILFIEVKYVSDGRPIYIEKDRFNILKYICNLAGAAPMICVFYKEIGDFRCLSLEDCDRSSSEYYVYDRKSFISRGKRVEDL